MTDRNLEFVVDARISQLGIPLAAAQICGLDNARRGPDPDPACDPQWSRFSPDFIGSDPILRGYRDLHTAVGRSNKRFVSSSEALIRFYLRSQSLPRVNPLVDLYNALGHVTQRAILFEEIVSQANTHLPIERPPTQRFNPAVPTQLILSLNPVLIRPVLARGLSFIRESKMTTIG